MFSNSSTSGLPTLSQTSAGKTIVYLRGFEPDVDGKRIFIDSRQIVDSGATASILVGELEQTDLSPPLKVALKVFQAIPTDISRDPKAPVALRLLRQELENSKKLNHSLILPFLGTCALDARTVLVSRFMENGNLSTYLEANPSADRDRLVFQVSHAVLYLHEIVGLAHGDLKCENVLVSSEGDALLADFGLSTAREKAATEDTTTVSIRGKGTLRFCAPELFLDDSQTQGRHRSKTTKSDIYAFGMLLLQAYTGKLPWHGMKDIAVITQVAVLKRIPPRPDVSEFNDILWMVCEACWRSDPDTRPYMRIIANILAQNMLSSSGIQALSPSRDILEYLNNVDLEHELPHLPLSEPISITSVLSHILEHPEDVNAIAYMPNSASIVSGCADGIIRVWDIKSGDTIGRPMKGYTDVVLSVAISADATRFASGLGDGTIRVWTVEHRATVVLLEGHNAEVNSVAFSPDGSCIVSGSDDETIRVWDLATGTTIVGPIHEHSHWVRSVAYSPDGARIVSSSWDRSICVWNSETGLNVWRAEMSFPVFSVAFSLDGKQIVAGCGDGSVHVLDAETGEIALGPLEGHTDWVNSVAFSPNGKIIASGSSDNTVRLWNAATGEELHVISGHNDSVYSVAFSPDGRRVASASLDRTVRIWNITNPVE